MPWTSPPKFIAEGITPIAANLLAAVTTHQTAALNYVNGGAGLLDFAAIRSSNSGRSETQFPVLLVDDASEEDDPSDDESRLDETMTINFLLGVTADSADQAVIDLYKYVRAVRLIWRSLRGTEITAGMNSSPGGCRLGRIRVNYGRAFKDQSQYIAGAFISTDIRLFER